MSVLAILPQTTQPQEAPERSSGLSLLEHLAAGAFERCSNPKAPLLFGEDTETNKSIVIRSACKQWSCPSCGARNARKWIARCINGTKTIGGQWYFMTITPHPKAKKENWSLKNLTSNWDKLRKRIVRAFGKFDFIKVFEPFKDGQFHMHLIVNAEIPYSEKLDNTGNPVLNDKGNPQYDCQWLEDNAAQCGLGWKSDYQPIRSAAGTAYYVAKYLVKMMDENPAIFPKHFKRISVSQSFPKLPDWGKESELDWTYIQDVDHLWHLAWNAKQNGHDLYGNNGMPTDVKELIGYYKASKGLQHDKRRNHNESRSNANGSTSKLVAKTGTRKTRTKRQVSRQQGQHGKKLTAKTVYQTIIKSFEQSTNEDEGILKSGKDTTRKSTREGHHASSCKTDSISTSTDSLGGCVPSNGTKSKT